MLMEQNGGSKSTLSTVTLVWLCWERCSGVKIIFWQFFYKANIFLNSNYYVLHTFLTILIFITISATPPPHTTQPQMSGFCLPISGPESFPSAVTVRRFTCFCVTVFTFMNCLAYCNQFEFKIKMDPVKSHTKGNFLKILPKIIL